MDLSDLLRGEPRNLLAANAMTTPFPTLFSPIKIGSRTSRNRVMRTATSTGLAENGQATDGLIEFYRVLARGGVGTIVTGVTRVHRDQAGGGVLALSDRQNVPSLRRLTDAVHAEHTLIIAQLYHGGRQHTGRRPETLVAPSAIACPFSGGIPHALTIGEVDDMIDSFVMSAANAIEAGFDGVEIHGGQGHLVQQFFSPLSNQRDDRYGGSSENRLRFPRELAERIRYRIGTQAILGYRLGIHEFTAGGITIEDSKQAAAQFEQDGFIDYLSLTQSNFNTIETHVPDRHYPETPYAGLQAQIKQSAPRVVTVASTRIQSPEQAEKLLSDGVADLIGLGRALIVDPDWPRKSLSGNAARIRLCIACNHCWDSLEGGGALRCATNPTVGRELKYGPISKSRTRQRVAVVGGGPAGLEAARISAQRGHAVTLWERGSQLGGKLLAASQIRYHEEISNVTTYLITELQRTNASIRLGEAVTAAGVLAEQPDSIILATGATAIAPDIVGDGSVPVFADDGSLELSEIEGELVVLMDEDSHWWAAAIAQKLVQAGKRVVFVTRFFEPFRELPQVSRIPTLQSLSAGGIELLPGQQIALIDAGGVVLRDYRGERSRRIDNVAAVLWVGMQRSNSELASDLKSRRFRNYRVIGDAFAPRRLPNALLDGHAAGRDL